LTILSAGTGAAGKIVSGRKVLPKLSARNAIPSANFPLSPPETGQYTAKSVLPGAETEAAFLPEKSALQAEEKSRLSASAAETAGKIIPDKLWTKG